MRSGSGTSARSATRPQRPLRHPGPPRPGQGVGRRAGCAVAGPAPLLRARNGGDAGSEIAIEVSTAGLRKPVAEIYPSRSCWRCAWMPAGRSRCRPMRTSRSSRLRVRVGAAPAAGSRRRAAVGLQRPRAKAGAAPVTPTARVGIGYDAHRFSGVRALVLGGVEIPGVPGLQATPTPTSSPTP